MDQQSKRDRKTAYKQRRAVGGVYAIKNTANGRILLMGTADMEGSRNRFSFSRQTGGCNNLKLNEDWKKYGADAFVFEVVAELKKGELQSDREFMSDIEALKEMYLAEYDAGVLY